VLAKSTFSQDKKVLLLATGVRDFRVQQLFFCAGEMHALVRVCISEGATVFLFRLNSAITQRSCYRKKTRTNQDQKRISSLNTVKEAKTWYKTFSFTDVSSER